MDECVRTRVCGLERVGKVAAGSIKEQNLHLKPVKVDVTAV